MPLRKCFNGWTLEPVATFWRGSRGKIRAWAKAYAKRWRVILSDAEGLHLSRKGAKSQSSARGWAQQRLHGPEHGARHDFGPFGSGMDAVTLQVAQIGRQDVGE